MRHEVITDASDFRALEQDWSMLLARSGRDLLPLSYLWTTIWWKNFGGERKPRIHCFYAGDKLIAVVPMLLESTKYRRVRIRRMASMANGHSPYTDLLIDREVTSTQLGDLVCRIVASADADLTTFIRVGDDSSLCQLFRHGLRPNHHAVGLKGDFTTPLIRIDTDWETFFGQRSQKFRKSMRNKVNRFQRTAGCIIERRQITSPADPVLADMILVSRNSWKGKIGTDLGSTPASRSFLADLIENLGPNGGTEVWVARLGDQPIAYEFHAKYGGVTYPLRADFDENYRELSPGSVVEYTVLRDLFKEQRVMLYDSCANNYWYLSNWTSEYRTHSDIEIFGKGWKSRCLHAVEYRLIPLLRYCRDHLNMRPSNETIPASRR
jgi:CelD/BcsL family acetyltransferase involved in cellulose biosynthesis